eukprot:687128-Prymnesium_polylepis.1
MQPLLDDDGQKMLRDADHERETDDGPVLPTATPPNVESCSPAPSTPTRSSAAPAAAPAANTPTRTPTSSKAASSAALEIGTVFTSSSTLAGSVPPELASSSFDTMRRTRRERAATDVQRMWRGAH